MEKASRRAHLAVQCDGCEVKTVESRRRGSTSRCAGAFYGNTAFSAVIAPGMLMLRTILQTIWSTEDDSYRRAIVSLHWISEYREGGEIGNVKLQQKNQQQPDLRT